MSSDNQIIHGFSKMNSNEKLELFIKKHSNPKVLE